MQDAACSQRLNERIQCLLRIGRGAKGSVERPGNLFGRTGLRVERKNGEVSRAVFTGKQAQLKQVNDDGTPVTATADRLEYDVLNDVITLTGNYKVTSPKGSNSGQKMVYNTKTGSMQSGGDGTRVRTVIQPKNKAAAPPSGATK